MPEESQLRAETDGFVLEILATPGQPVRAGQELIRTEDPLLQTQVRLMAARVAELEAQLASLQFVDRARADATRKDLESSRRTLEVGRERLASLTVKSPHAGRLVIPRAGDLPGRFLKRGEVIGWVAESRDTLVRVVVSQDDIGLVRDRTVYAEAMLSDWGAAPMDARVVREVPAGSDRLPNRALGAAGGGRFAIDPRDQEALTTLEKIFQLDLHLAGHVGHPFVGQRVFVRFDHGREALAAQLFRSIRQLFLSRFGV